ncbi:MAG: hypothetical protein HOC74_02040, partial [Gemmatimonadetes bacterium]|nr:hypothetical protein [Gemmatimonadota bacterium]
MDLSKLTDDRIISEWLLHEAETEGRIDLPMDIGDWSVANEIRAEILLPPDIDAWIAGSMTSGHRSEGMSEDDGYSFNAISSPRGGNIWEGWKEFRFPAECFYPQGKPTGWEQMTSGHINCPPGVRARNVRLIQRDITTGPRMTDEGLLEALNQDHTGLEAVRSSGSPD